MTTVEDTPVTITLGASDPDGDALTFSIVRPPRRGRLTGGGPTAGPTVTYTPRRNTQGPDAFVFAVSDGQLTLRPATVVVTVVAANDPPSVAPIADQTVLVDSEPHRVAITRISPGPNDERRQTVTIAATSSNPALIPHPTVVGTRASRALVFRPNPGMTGTAVVTATADDGQPVNYTFSRTFTVTVNAPPTAQAPGR